MSNLHQLLFSTQFNSINVYIYNFERTTRFLFVSFGGGGGSLKRIRSPMFCCFAFSLCYVT